MSRPKFSSATPSDLKKLDVSENTQSDCAHNSPASTDHGSLGKCARDRVLKEVGITSTAFIGPAYPPEPPRAKSDIEDTLSEFYKELEKIDTPDEGKSNLGKRHVQPVIPQVTRVEEKNPSTRNSSQTDGYHKEMDTGQRQRSWPHWYRNEPYHLKGRRPEAGFSDSLSDQNQWDYPHQLTKPPDPRFHRPPLPHQPQHSPFPNPQNAPPNGSPSFKSPETTSRYHNDYNCPPFGSFPPPNICGDSPQGLYATLQHRFDRDDRIYNYDTHSASAAVGWSRDRKEGSQCDEDYDGPQRFYAEHELWEQPHYYEPHCDTRQPSSVLILMRGLPGSGKTTLARELLSTGPSGVILSTDDYFANKDGYCYDPGLLGLAHEWNQSRAEDALHNGRSPIIIDNTNLQAWEMKPYVRMALERGYKVDFCEPDTSWKFDPYELEKRNKHGVHQGKIAQMMDRFSFPVSVDIVMSSQEPPHVTQRCRPELPQMQRRNDFH